MSGFEADGRVRFDVFVLRYVEVHVIDGDPRHVPVFGEVSDGDGSEFWRGRCVEGVEDVDVESVSFEHPFESFEGAF